MVLLFLHREGDSQCHYSALLILFVIASLFPVSHSVPHGSRLSHFTSFLVFLLQQCARGLCCGCKHGSGMCNFQETGKQASCSTVTGNRLCTSLGPALLRPTGRDCFTELWKLGFPFLHRAGTVFWRWFSLSLQAGRKVICKLRVTCHRGGETGRMANVPW